MAIIQWEDTLACLVVEPVGGDTYTAPNIPMDYRRIFGGQILAQVLCVGAETVESKGVSSLHAIFPAPGDLARRISIFRQIVQPTFDRGGWLANIVLIRPNGGILRTLWEHRGQPQWQPETAHYHRICKSIAGRYQWRYRSCIGSVVSAWPLACCC